MRFLALIFMLAAGCITPSIPIPPPDPAMMMFDIAGDPLATTAVFSYPAEQNYAGALVIVFNQRTGSGIIDTARGDGSVGPTAAFPAILGDQVVVSFQREDQTVSTCIKLRQGTQSSTAFCD